MISVRQARDLPPASSRSHLAVGTLALGYILPATGRIRDFHPLERAPAGRTMKLGSILIGWSLSLKVLESGEMGHSESGENGQF